MKAIKVFSIENLKQAILLRDVWAALEIKSDYSHWTRDQLEYFVENQDFIISVLKDEKSGRGRPKIEHAVTLEVAKHIALMSRVPKGREYRQKLIELEAQQTKPLTPAEHLRLTADILEAQERQQQEIDVLKEAQRITEAKLEDFATGAEHFSITAYCKLFRKESISHSAANTMGRILTSWARNQGIELGKAPHPVWGTINTYPKALLDAYFEIEKPVLN